MTSTPLPSPFSSIPLTPPAVFPAPGFAAPDVRALFFESVPCHGRPTRVFAWMGVPRPQPGATCPGIVLLHGGGGTAFDEWARLWNAFPAHYDPASGRVEAQLPWRATVWFLNVFDDRGCVVSTPHEEIVG